MNTFKTTPFAHQLSGINKAAGRDAFAYFCEMGTGKTWMVINEIARMWGEGKIDAALVFAPKGVHTNWVVNELPKHMPDWVLWEARWWKSGAGKIYSEYVSEILSPGPERVLRVLVMNWDSIVHESGFDFAERFCRTTSKLIIVGDESQRIKNPSAERSKALRRLKKYSSARRILSGSSVLNSPFDLWNQMDFLDPFILNSGSFHAFKTEYAELLQPGNKLLDHIVKSKVRLNAEVHLRMKASANTVLDICQKNGRLELVTLAEELQMHVADRDCESVVDVIERIKAQLNPNSRSPAKTELLSLLHGVQSAAAEYINRLSRAMSDRRRLPAIVAKGKNGQKKYRNLDRLSKLLEPHCFRAFKKDCLDLPAKIYKQAFYDLSAAQRAAYKKMKEEARLLLQDGSETPVNKLAALMKLAQICSGYVLEPVTGNVMLIEKGETPKLALLRDRLEEREDSDGGVIIWARFREEQAQIARVCADLGLSYGVYNGSTSDDERKRIVAEFEAGDLDVFIGQQQAGGTGITLVRADYVIYYSNSFSLEDRVQSEDRAHRIGQRRHVVYEDLLGSNTLEPQVLKVLEDKQSIADIISGANAVSLLGPDPSDNPF